MNRPLCSYCKSEIDPETCHCGIATVDHTFGDGHSPVPMGCTCHMDIEIVEADRPGSDEDTPENWRKMISNGLKDFTRQNAFGSDDFVECDSCAAKPGSPSLCMGCLANRNTIGRLRDLRRGR